MVIEKLWHMCEYIILEDFLMVKLIFDDSNGLWYELIEDYYRTSAPFMYAPPKTAVFFLFGGYLSLSKDSLRVFGCLPCACSCLSLFWTLPRSGRE